MWGWTSKAKFHPRQWVDCFKSYLQGEYLKIFSAARGERGGALRGKHRSAGWTWTIHQLPLVGFRKSQSPPDWWLGLNLFDAQGVLLLVGLGPVFRGDE